MDSLAAAPGTGPATSPLPLVRSARARRFEDLPTDRTLVMGILNVTPDSFSDGGQFAQADSAIQAGLKMHCDGADIIDVGGESTRPDSVRVTAEEEQQRILPVVEALVKAGALVSVDTMNASTAEKAIQAGAALINDVSGLEVDPAMPALIARTGAHYVLMHSRGAVRSSDPHAEYDSVVDDVITELTKLRDQFYAAGATPEQIILDPGLGFSKHGNDNWELLRSIDKLNGMGHRVLIGASRKRFLGSLLARSGKAAPPLERDDATVAITALAAFSGVWCVRVHNVGPSLDAVKTTAAWKA
ncbi:dihydropteroate synthase [Arthrobacter sp. zg-Y820]|uniref:dihydropteroate synthase n=1 Tax=unclassified Arthrobacter TaxID=235627 RepID=UPI001E348FD1|nr:MULTISPECIES: dihydropteroate synthase [unclassified Arthrobacter]MCC9197451.1 dihydropteroate synthase [Arthrobacter sp. zg-Y820]MDK1280318.1 dihydropteroate synthase [Arthrobacter sp. zg.Y820]WIB09604.1 dihydropteroate synthase [Arthrobacter sp. zg-Y820]